MTRTGIPLLALLVLLAVAASGCATSGNAPNPQGQRSVGEVIDDATITTRVKTKLLDDPVVKGLQIDVDTVNGVVFLTGTVNSQEEKQRAIELARETSGVREVRGDLTVKSEPTGK
jgi:hyperosmotically inducible protein